MLSRYGGGGTGSIRNGATMACTYLVILEYCLNFSGKNKRRFQVMIK